MNKLLFYEYSHFLPIYYQKVKYSWNVRFCKFSSFPLIPKISRTSQENTTEMIWGESKAFHLLAHTNSMLPPLPNSFTNIWRCVQPWRFWRGSKRHSVTYHVSLGLDQLLCCPAEKWLQVICGFLFCLALLCPFCQFITVLTAGRWVGGSLGHWEGFLLQSWVLCMRYHYDQQ